MKVKIVPLVFCSKKKLERRNTQPNTCVDELKGFESIFMKCYLITASVSNDEFTENEARIIKSVLWKIYFKEHFNCTPIDFHISTASKNYAL